MTILTALTPFEWLQRERGICSVVDCYQPIEGYCATCNAKGPFKAPKFCKKHLADHCRAARHVPHHLYDDGGAA